MKYRVGRKQGLVVLDENSRVVAHCEQKEIAKEICVLLNYLHNDSPFRNIRKAFVRFVTPFLRK